MTELFFIKWVCIWKFGDGLAVKCLDFVNFEMFEALSIIHWLNDGLMIKDNHIASIGIGVALERLEEIQGVTFIEFEVDTETQALQVASFLHKNPLQIPCGILFDNFVPQALAKLLSSMNRSGMLNGLFAEASGRITLENLPSYDIEHLDYVSSGSITMDPYPTDLSLELDKK